jgi:hypothetical protein
VARSFTVELQESGYTLEGKWSEESRRVARFLTTFVVPFDLKTRSAIRSFKTRTLNFVRKGKLWQRPNNSKFEPKLIDDDVSECKKILEELHHKVGHKGRDETYRRIHKLYFRRGLYKDVQGWIQACSECQKWDPRRFEEPAPYTQPSALPWARWSLDIQYLPGQGGKKRRVYCVEARDDLTGYPEACLSSDRTAARVFDFVYENILSRWEWPLSVTVDGGSEFKGIVKEGLEALKTKRVNISPYNSRANGQVEGGYFSIASALAKMGTDQKGGLNAKLAAVLYADRTTTRARRGKTPFWLARGYGPVTRIEIDVPSWRIAQWDNLPLITSEPSEEEKRRAHEGLVQLRAQILLDSVDRHEEAAKRVGKVRRT